MGKLKVIKPGILLSIQDTGRNGYAFYASPISGVMDGQAAQMAQLILSNDLDWPIIECTSIAPQLEFIDDAIIALTGANARWSIDNNLVPLNKRVKVSSGDVLKGGPMIDGLRSYIGIQGKIKAQNHLGSTATYLPAKWGGINGQYLRKNDIVEWVSDTKAFDAFTEIEIQNWNKQFKLNIFKGPEYDWLSDSSKLLLTQNKYLITNATNRMGSKLKSDTPLEAFKTELDKSAPTFPGTIQLLPNGQLILLLQDGQTTGGYPRIAYMTEEETWRFNQMKIGTRINFQMHP